MDFNLFAKACLFSIATSISLNASAINYEQEINDVYDLLRFQNQSGSNKSRTNLVEQQMRLKLLEDYARQSAMKAAMIATNKQINQIIQSHARQLDGIYNFNALMIQGKVIPPVISEANDLYNQKGVDQLKLTKRIYNIEKQASFSSTAPNWRSYLNVNYEADAFDKISFMGGDLAPKNQEEMRAWRKATFAGWNIGVNEANIALQQKLERLNRDFIGMVRFHTMALQGRISMPVISSYNLYDKNNGIQWAIDEKLLRIEALPQFKQVGATQILSSSESGIILQQPTGQKSVVMNTLVNQNSHVDSNNIINARPTDANKNNGSIPPLNTIDIDKGLDFKTASQPTTSKSVSTSTAPTYALHGYINSSLPKENINVIKPLPTVNNQKSDANPKAAENLTKIINNEDIAPKPSLSPLDYVNNPYAPKQSNSKNLTIQQTITYTK